MSVDRCVCAGLTFEHLKQVSVERRLDFAALRRETGCCAGCGLCMPYVKQMLRTGCTDFEPGLPARPCSTGPAPVQPQAPGAARPATASSAKSS